ncbi:MAG TPA: thiamine pyrophosphate-requiring protein [Stellaceae bacterium]|nr:thiamine pyrophosphate-requiring protein [Stellaceae bacterium]
MAAEPANWTTVPADYRGDALVASMALGGVDHIFFTSGSELAFYQESLAKARYHNRPVPRLITVTHEHVSLNAALGYAAVSGKTPATAAHVDVGTQHYGCAVHTAWRSGLPVLITAGAAPSAYPGSMIGSREEGAHLWAQQVVDQNSIVRQYTKWDKRLEYQDNPGLMVSRALQVAKSEPCGPVYMSLPREIILLPMNEAKFPTVDQLGVPRPPALDSDSAREIAERLIKARNPFVVVAASGKNPETVPALVQLCELLGLPVVDAAGRLYGSFPMNHPLFQGTVSLKDADAVLVLEANVPWMPGPNAPGPDAWIAVVDHDPAKLRYPTYEFTAQVRLLASPLLAIRAITAAAEKLLGASDRSRAADRAQKWGDAARAQRRKVEEEAQAKGKSTPIDPTWTSYQLAQALDDNCIVIDDSMPSPRLNTFLSVSKPGSYFHNPGSSGGWGPGAALGAKIAAPDRDVVLASGDGFWQFGVSNAAIWSAAHHRAPFLAVVFQNRSYTTGTIGVTNAFGKDSFAKKYDYEGGYFDPPIDFAKEAEAAGAYGENVRDPAEVGPAIRRGLAQTRRGTPAVIAVWQPRLLHTD